MVRVSYLEIYNEEVRDLLGKDQTQRLEVRITEIGVLPQAIECLLSYDLFYTEGTFNILHIFGSDNAIMWFKNKNIVKIYALESHVLTASAHFSPPLDNHFQYPFSVPLCKYRQM